MKLLFSNLFFALIQINTSRFNYGFPAVRLNSAVESGTIGWKIDKALPSHNWHRLLTLVQVAFGVNIDLVNLFFFLRILTSTIRMSAVPLGLNVIERHVQKLLSQPHSFSPAPAPAQRPAVHDLPRNCALTSRDSLHCGEGGEEEEEESHALQPNDMPLLDFLKYALEATV